jgi:hypothetical protein
MKDSADPHARERALDITRQDPPPGISPEWTFARTVLSVVRSIKPPAARAR